MRVELVYPTEDMVRQWSRLLMTLAARTCYSAQTPTELLERLGRAEMRRTLEHVITSGHHSVLEHLNFTFAIEGISRACSHQLVRHRHGSYSQQSQRYVRFEGGADVVIPPSIAANPSLKALFEGVAESLQLVYDLLMERGVPEEDARYILPQATPTNLLVTYNLRALVDICKLRLCTLAQWEIRQVFKQIRRILGRIDPLYYDILTIKCVWNGYCDEKRNESGRCKIRPYRPPRELKGLIDDDSETTDPQG